MRHGPSGLGVGAGAGAAAVGAHAAVNPTKTRNSTTKRTIFPPFLPEFLEVKIWIVTRCNNLYFICTEKRNGVNALR
jgi:hypothetical protein